MSNEIPIEAIIKGRSMEEVLNEFMRIWDGAREAATKEGKSPDDVFADTMQAAAYRLYLLGVQDGMKVENQ